MKKTTKKLHISKGTIAIFTELGANQANYILGGRIGGGKEVSNGWEQCCSTSCNMCSV